MHDVFTNKAGGSIYPATCQPVSRANTVPTEALSFLVWMVSCEGVIAGAVAITMETRGEKSKDKHSRLKMAEPKAKRTPTSCDKTEA